MQRFINKMSLVNILVSFSDICGDGEDRRVFIRDSKIFVWLKMGNVRAKIGLTGQLDRC